MRIKTILIILVAVILIFIIVSAITVRVNNQKIIVTDFVSCAQAGYPILETYPEQCTGPDNKMYTEAVATSSMPAPSSIVATSTTASTTGVISSPKSNSIISSPLDVEGSAPNSWYFEGSFPIGLLDASGTVVAQGQAKAKSDWTVAGPVAFQATLSFNNPATATGTLVIMNDNPSGDPARSLNIKIPVTFASSTRH